ncbi:hypothetical protein G6F49_013695 [Rhizopus delemar]|nr:hypothetical protein G6F49_013695 [Rhizopus delemar]KAG1571177.1 hypothetical protein G6F48_013502 [Rhizopus delemar]
MYLTSRYIGPTEAVWRLFEYAMHEEDPSVTSLAIHLENEQPVYFDPESSAEEIQQTLDNTHSTLMGFFKYNLTHDDGRNYLYQEFPSHYSGYQNRSHKTVQTLGFLMKYKMSPYAHPNSYYGESKLKGTFERFWGHA